MRAARKAEPPKVRLKHGLAAPAPGGGMTFLQAKTANEVLKAQERRLRLAKLRATSWSATGR